MLRFHFTAEDLARTRVAAAPHPLWEIAVSLHRFQTRKGRWAYAHWYRTACGQLREAGLGPMVHQFLLPLFPRASYFPDFLTPAEGAEGLEAGLDAVLAAPRQRVAQETRRLARTISTPDWVSRLTEGDMRGQLVQTLRAYHHTVIAPPRRPHRRTPASRTDPPRPGTAQPRHRSPARQPRAHHPLAPPGTGDRHLSKSPGHLPQRQRTTPHPFLLLLEGPHHPGRPRPPTRDHVPTPPRPPASPDRQGTAPAHPSRPNPRHHLARHCHRSHHHRSRPARRRLYRNRDPPHHRAPQRRTDQQQPPRQHNPARPHPAGRRPPRWRRRP